MSNKVRVMLADPHAIVREGVRLLVDQREGLEVVAEVGDGQEAVETAARLVPDVVVCELALPRLSGFESARQIRKANADTAVLMLSCRDSRNTVEEALRAGAAGYVLKRSSSAELIEAIRAVARGESFLSPSVTHHLVDAVANPSDGAHSSLSQLTHRECEVLQLIAEGNSSKEVATLIGVSLKTIESHRSSLMTKLGIHKVASLVRFAIREGLIEA